MWSKNILQNNIRLMIMRRREISTIRKILSGDINGVTREWYISHNGEDYWILPIGGTLCDIFKSESKKCCECPLHLQHRYCYAMHDDITNNTYLNKALIVKLSAWQCNADRVLCDLLDQLIGYEEDI